MVSDKNYKLYIFLHYLFKLIQNQLYQVSFRQIKIFFLTHIFFIYFQYLNSQMFYYLHYTFGLLILHRMHWNLNKAIHWHSLFMMGILK